MSGSNAPHSETYNITPEKPTPPDALFIVRRTDADDFDISPVPVALSGTVHFSNRTEHCVFLHHGIPGKTLMVPANECRSLVLKPEPKAKDVPIYIVRDDKCLNLKDTRYLKLEVDPNGAKNLWFAIEDLFDCLICKCVQKLTTDGEAHPFQVEIQTRPPQLPVNISISTDINHRPAQLQLNTTNPSGRFTLNGPFTRKTVFNLEASDPGDARPSTQKTVFNLGASDPSDARLSTCSDHHKEPAVFGNFGPEITIKQAEIIIDP